MFTATFFMITRHGNIDLGSMMPRNSDMGRHTPEALRDIPHGIKKVLNTYILRTDWWMPDSGKGRKGLRWSKVSCLSDKIFKSCNILCHMETKANPAG